MWFIMFSSRNGTRTIRWWESKACSTRSGFRRDPRPTLQTRAESSFFDTYIIGSIKSSICAVDRCSDYIFMWITRFGQVWFPTESQSESKSKCNIHCVIINMPPHGLLLSVHVGTTDVVSFLLHKDYSYIDDHLCVFVIHKDYSYIDDHLCVFVIHMITPTID